MKRIYGTGKVSEKTGKVNLAAGRRFIVPDELAAELVECGSARYTREVEEIVPVKEKQEQPKDIEKVEVTVPKKKRYGKA